MTRPPALRIALTVVLLGIAVAASLAEGVARIGLSLTALAILPAFSRCLPAQRTLPHPAIQGAMGVVGGVCIIAVAFGIYLVFVLAGVSNSVLVCVALVLTALSAFLATRYSSSI